MLLRSRRSSILATNIANSDTPNFKARDLDFESLMNNSMAGSLSTTRTHQRHISANPAMSSDPSVKYRIPLNASLDGNTVDMHAEQGRFAENALQYQTSLTLLSGKIRGLLLAIKGQ